MQKVVAADCPVAHATVPRRWLIALPGIVALAIFGTWHVASTSFWYDETVQFWIARGQDALGPPQGTAGNLWAAIRTNGVANLDPGGFTLILRYWVRISTGEIWQRLLPFLFFVAAIAAMGWVGWQQRRSVRFALLSAAVPALFPLLLDYAIEIRAYSMEFSGIVIGCVLLDRLAARPAPSTALLAGAIFSFYMTSRYSFVLFTCAACLTLFVLWWQRRATVPWMDSVRALACFCGPVAVTGMLILAFALWPQYKSRITYEGGVLVAYLSDTTAAGKTAGEIAKNLAVNLLHPAGLPLTITAVLGVIALLPERLAARLGLRKVLGEIEGAGIAPFALLGLAMLVLTGLLWRWHPWAIAAKWSLSLQALSAVAVVRLLAAWLPTSRRNDTALRGSGRTLAIVLLLATLALDLRLALYRRSNWPTFAPALAYLETQNLPAGSVVMDVHTYPTVRYFHEYGFLVSSRNFPDAFRLPYWDAPKPLIVPQTRFVITVYTLEDAKKVFAPAKITGDPGLPDQLYRVEPSTEGTRQ